MTNVMMFIADNPIIFLFAVLIIYLVIVRNKLIKKNKEINKVYKPLEEYLVIKLNQIEDACKKILLMYPNEEKLKYELTKLIKNIDKSKKGEYSIIDVSNEVNYLSLNYLLLKTDMFNSEIIKQFELFNKNSIKVELEEDRVTYNNLINEYNHDIINPINNLIVLIFNLRTKSSLIETNEGKEPIQIVKNSIDIEPNSNEVSDDDDETVKKICPNCKYEFKNTNICPVCGSVVI